MATGSFIGVTPGAGAKLATSNTYTEGANVVQDEKVILGEQYLAEYRNPPGIAFASTATADSHLLQVMAGAALNVYVRRIRVYQMVAATAAAIIQLHVVRLSTAGTGGTALTFAPMDTTDAAAGATSMMLPTVKGTESVVLDSIGVYFIQTVPVSLIPGMVLIADFDYRGERQKSLRIPAGTANGIAIKNRNAAVAGASVSVVVELTEAPF